MRIAQIAPLVESVPPKFYGGTERIVSYITEELVALGHDVTLFASGDSWTSARLVQGCAVALRLNPAVRDPLPYHVALIDEVRRRASEFDMLHFHCDFLHAPVVRDFANRTVTTLHGRLDLPDLPAFYSAFPELPLVSISNDQRRPLPSANFVATVQHGLPINLLRFSPRPEGGYLAFLGRISPEKRPDRAIEIAARAGRRLRIAAKVDAVDRLYWDKAIEPMIRANPNIEFVGEIDEGRKSSFLGAADALLFPIDWPEPFGLVMIEAMACGTPVIAFDQGSVREVIDHGVTGFVVRSIDEATDAVAKIGELDRRAIRSVFEKRFSVRRMALDYVSIYRKLAGRTPGPTVATDRSTLELEDDVSQATM